MVTEAKCVGCGRVVKLGKYYLQGEYRCAKCRGIEIPKKQKQKRIENKTGLHIR